MGSKLQSALNFVGSFLVVLITILLLAQILGRYVLSVPWPWTEELARYALIWVSFLGAWIGMREKAHFRIVMSIKWTSGFGRWMDIFCSVTVLGVIVYGGFFLLPRLAATMSPVLGLSMSIVYGPVAVLSGLMGIDMLLSVRGRKK